MKKNFTDNESTFQFEQIGKKLCKVFSLMIWKYIPSTISILPCLSFIICTSMHKNLISVNSYFLFIIILVFFRITFSKTHNFIHIIPKM